MEAILGQQIDIQRHSQKKQKARVRWCGVCLLCTELVLSILTLLCCNIVYLSIIVCLKQIHMVVIATIMMTVCCSLEGFGVLQNVSHCFFAQTEKKKKQSWDEQRSDTC